MLNDYLEQLKSTDPELRRQAIIALGREKDPAALPALADAYRNDPDVALRDLALKAGRYIKSAVASQDVEAPPESALLPIEAPPVANRPPKPIKGSDIQRARGYFDQAVTYHVRNESLKAIESMGKAVDANPNLATDTMFINMAMELTALGSMSAVSLIADPVERKNFILTRKKGGPAVDNVPLFGRGQTIQSGSAGGPAMQAAPVQEATWNEAFIDLSVYGFVNAAIVFIFSLVALQALMTALLGAFSASSYSNFATNTLTNGQTATSVSLPTSLLYAVIYGVVSVVMLVILQGAVHLVATTVMGGAGTMAGLIHKTTLFYTIFIPVSTLISLLPLLFNNNDLRPIFNIISLIFLVGTAIWSGKLTGTAYAFGTGKGCASIVLGTIVLVLAIGCCSVVFTTALSQVFSNALGGLS